MIRSRWRVAAISAGLALGLNPAAPALTHAQAPVPAQQPADPVAAIEAEFSRGVLQLELQRLDAIAKLATSQPPAAAEQTWLAYFRAALSGGHYAHAEKFAGPIVANPKASPELLYLADVASILAKVERGAFDDALQSLSHAIGMSKPAANAGASAAAVQLPLETRIALLEVAEQKLHAAGRYDIARQAFELIQANSPDETVRGFAAARLRHLALVGQPAPALVGTDLDGKPFDLASLKGKVVLVVFWASWCLPSSSEALQLVEFAAAQADRGFVVVGVNLDTLQDGSQDPASVLPDVRRFLAQHNVRWPNLINGQGAQNYAESYRVTEVPSNALIGRDGKVEQLDLSGKALESAALKALAR